MKLAIQNRRQDVVGICLLACAFALLIASNASAAGSVSATAGAVTFTAGAGDGSNGVTVDHNGLAYVISDSVALTAGSGCTQINSTSASCAGTFGKDVTLNLGEALDSVVVDSTAESHVPSTARVTVNGEADGTNVSAGNATAAIAINSSAGNFTTGSGPDVLVVGGAGFTSNIYTGANADSITFTTDLPKATYDPDLDPIPYPDGFSYLNESWPVYVHSDAGADYVDGSGSTGAFWYEYGAGCDLIIGGAGSDWFAAGSSGTEDDTIIAGAGNDVLYAYPGNDGDDMFYGGAGNDTLNLWDNTADEMFDGGTGIDWVKYQTTTAGATSSLTLDGLRNDGILGNDNFSSTVERIGGSVAGDGTTFVGNADANILTGNSGPDTFTGGPGADTMNGNAGNDTFYAWDGQVDTVNCGAGTDTVDADSTDVLVGCENVTTH